MAPAAAPKRQRLALVIGIGSLGQRVVLESARRDSEAVAAALRSGGFEVMLHEDIDGAELRAALTRFRERLRADGVGLIYFTGLAAQLDGRNLLLPGDAVLNDALAPPAMATVLRAGAVPLQELVDALAGGPDSPRLLMVDAAYRHPALSRLSPLGLARQRLNPGTMALLGHAPAALQEMPAVSALPNPPPTDLRELAASRFARVVVDALTTPRISVPEALRAIRAAVVDSSGGRTQPWLGGDTFSREYLADAALLELPTAAPVAPVAPAAAAAAATPSGGSAAAPLPAAPAPAPAAAAAVATAAAAAVATTLAVVTPAATAATAPAPAASAPVLPPERRVTDGRTAQAPSQGERPVFQARKNSFDHAEGDTLTYQVTNTVKDELLHTYTISVDAVLPDGQLEANGGRMQLDAQGRLKRQQAEGNESTFDPAQTLWWARASTGENREVSFRETYVRAERRGTIEWRGNALVGAARQVETLAGVFSVLPIVIKGTALDTPAGGRAQRMQFARTVWYAPKLGMPVAIDVEDKDEAGRVLRRERIELTQVQQSRSLN